MLIEPECRENVKKIKSTSKSKKYYINKDIQDLHDKIFPQRALRLCVSKHIIFSYISSPIILIMTWYYTLVQT